LCAVFVTERRRGADPDPERFQHTGDIVINLTVRSPISLNHDPIFNHWITDVRPVCKIAIYISL